MWRIRLVLKRCKVLKYYDQDCLNFFCCSLHFLRWFHFLKKVLIWLKNVSSIKKLRINKVKSFPKSNFDQNQIFKIALTQSHKIWNFSATHLLYIFIKYWRNALKKMSKIEFWRRLGRVMTWNMLSQEIPNKIFETKYKSPVKLDRTRKVWCLLSGVF